MEIKTKYNFGDIVYFTENTTVYEARIVGVKITEDIPDSFFNSDNEISKIEFVE